MALSLTQIPLSLFNKLTYLLRENFLDTLQLSYKTFSFQKSFGSNGI